MHFETRYFGSKKHLLIVCDTKEEELTVQAILGKKEPVTCNGEVQRADGHRELYIRLESGKQSNLRK